jgi:hypothetical protein
MGMKDKAKEMADKAMDAVKGEHVDKAGERLDEKSGGKHTDKIDKGEQMAKDQLDKRKGQPGAGGDQPQ